MPDRFCPSCGTEVEADARFCPSCGTTLAMEDAEAAGAADPALPPAPAWPTEEEPTLTDAPVAQPPLQAAEEVPASEPPVAEPPREAVAPAAPSAPPPPSAPEAPSGSPPASALPPAGAERIQGSSAAPVTTSSDMPITWPTTIAGWLIGAGSLMGAIFLIASLGNVVSLVLFVALLGITATVFAADRMPEIPHLRLLVLATTMIGLGVGLARAGFTVAGADTLFLLAMLAAGGGALLIELDRDRPWPPAEQSGG